MRPRSFFVFYNTLLFEMGHDGDLVIKKDNKTINFAIASENVKAVHGVGRYLFH